MCSYNVLSHKILSHKTCAHNKQQGIALIQVLLITAILSVLALYLTSTAKDQVKVAQWQDDKSDALVAVHSAEAELLYTLLVNSKIKNAEGINSNNNIINNWNFFDKPFVINNQVDANIQDQRALIHAHFPDAKVLKAFIAFTGYGDKEVNVMYDNLLDWQDIDSIPRANGDESLSALNNIRNGAVPDLHDFSFVNNMTAELLQGLLKNTTLYGKGIFNPMNSSRALLTAITNAQIAQQVIQLREQGQLSPIQFSQLTGIVESDKVLMYPSNILAIDLEGKSGISVVRKQKIIELNPYADQYDTPINILSSSG
jgi:general secretion pathway protein K